MLLVGPSLAHAQSGPNWTGWYVGISGGYGWGSSTQTGAPPPPPPPATPPPLFDCGDGVFVTDPSLCPGDGSYSTRGGLAGAGVSYLHQFGVWVAGIDADFSFAGIGGHSNTCNPASPHECGAKLRSLGTVRGRLGVANGTWLPYLTGGFAFGDVQAYDVSAAGASGNRTLSGWTFGGGIETIIVQNWSLKIEYLYVDLGQDAIYDTRPGFPEQVSFTANILRLGVNYRFAPGH